MHHQVVQHIEVLGGRATASAPRHRQALVESSAKGPKFQSGTGDGMPYPPSAAMAAYHWTRTAAILCNLCEGAASVSVDRCPHSGPAALRRCCTMLPVFTASLRRFYSAFMTACGRPDMLRLSERLPHGGSGPAERCHRRKAKYRVDDFSQLNRLANRLVIVCHNVLLVSSASTSCVPLRRRSPP